VRVFWLVSLTQRLSRCLWTMLRPSRRRPPFGLQGGLIPLLVWADRRVMRAHAMWRIFNRRAATQALCTENVHHTMNTMAGAMQFSRG
jgi:hypothetical protein